MHVIPVLGFGFLRRSTDYLHVVEGRYDEFAGQRREPNPKKSPHQAGFYKTKRKKFRRLPVSNLPDVRAELQPDCLALLAGDHQKLHSILRYLKVQTTNHLYLHALN